MKKYLDFKRGTFLVWNDESAIIVTVLSSFRSDETAEKIALDLGMEFKNCPHTFLSNTTIVFHMMGSAQNPKGLIADLMHGIEPEEHLV